MAGYDDEETIELKRKFANNQCYGGLMAWSVDFNSGSGDDLEPSKSTNGQCGPENNGMVCPGSGFGDCCSSSGWCGSGDSHCGSACISGDCQTGGVTSNGRCGAGFHDFICGNWEQGPCCSAGGWCGDSDAHCGSGCQSGCDGNSGGLPGGGGSGCIGGGCGSDDDDNGEEDDDGDDGVSGKDICDMNTEEWDQQLWQDLELGTWFQSRMDRYGREGWPDIGEYQDSIPEAIAKWDADGEADAEMYWPGVCKE